MVSVLKRLKYLKISQTYCSVSSFSANFVALDANLLQDYVGSYWYSMTALGTVPSTLWLEDVCLPETIPSQVNTLILSNRGASMRKQNLTIASLRESSVTTVRVVLPDNGLDYDKTFHFNLNVLSQNIPSTCRFLELHHQRLELLESSDHPPLLQLTLAFSHSLSSGCLVTYHERQVECQGCHYYSACLDCVRLYHEFYNVSTEESIERDIVDLHPCSHCTQLYCRRCILQCNVCFSSMCHFHCCEYNVRQPCTNHCGNCTSVFMCRACFVNSSIKSKANGNTVSCSGPRTLLIVPTLPDDIAE
jgi:hypothetical protein